MIVKEFPGCCSAQILCDFGGTNTSFARGWEVKRKELLKEFMEKGNWLKTQGFITATTNCDQKEGEKLLRYLGFKHTKSASGNHHKPMKLWFIDAAILRKNYLAIRNGTYKRMR